MDDLIAWLRAQLDEDERVAQEQPPFPWRAVGDEVWASDNYPVADAFALSSNQTRHVAAFIALHDPARVLREVESKRLLLNQFELRGNSVRATVVPSTGGVWDDLLRLLALPFADRPGYREEWRP